MKHPRLPTAQHMLSYTSKRCSSKGGLLPTRCCHSPFLSANGSKQKLISQETVHHVGIHVAQFLVAKYLGQCSHNRKAQFLP